MKAKANLSFWIITVALLFGAGIVIAVPLKPKPGDGTSVLDLDSTPGDQNVRILYDVKPRQAVNVQVLLNQEVAAARTFGVILKFDPKKLSVILGKGDGVFASAVSPGPPDVQNNILKYGEALLQGSVIAKGPVALLFFRTSSDFSGDTEIVLTELKIGVTGASKDFAPQASVVLSSGMLSVQEDFVEGVRGIPGDIDRDGDVDFDDFFALATNFGKTGSKPTDGIRTVTQTVAVYDSVVVTKTVRDTVRISDPAGGSRYVYTFDDVNQIEKWLKRDTGTARVETGKLILAGRSNAPMTLFLPNIFSGDIDLEVVTEWKSGADNFGFGVEFRGSQVGVYAFRISGNGQYAVSKWNAEKVTTLINWTPSNFINRRGKNTLRVVTLGNLFKFYINGVLVDQITDSDFKEGLVGLRVEDVQEVAFDNFVVVEPGATVRRDTIVVTKIVRDTVFMGGVKRDTVVITSDQLNRPPIKSSWSEVDKENRPAVYWLGVTARGSNYQIIFVGTGFAVAPDVICTNIHVALAIDKLLKTIKQDLRPAVVAIKADGRPTEQDMYYLGIDEQERGLLGLAHPEYDGTTSSPDVALIGVHTEEKKRFSVAVSLIGLKDSKELNIGDEIATIGYPGELEKSFDRSAIHPIPTLKTGIISALRPYRAEYRSENPMGRVSNKIVQHNFDTTPGTSGSPIFNRRGEVVAINHAGFQTGSIGFGIRADEIRHMAQALSVDAGKYLGPNATKPTTLKQSLLSQENGAQ